MVWELEDKVATLHGDHFVATFQRDEPHQGLRIQSDSLHQMQLFSFLVSDHAQETYVRGHDLISKYPARNSDLVSYQTYFRQIGSSAGIEFILSAQTSLLESAPMTKVVSRLPAADVLAPIGNGCQQIEADDLAAYDAANWFLLRHTDESPFSSLLLVHPSDFYRVDVDPVDGAMRIQFSVFPDSLEKGVIRRARFQWRLLPRQHDVAQAMEWTSNVKRSAPPLTT